MRTLWVGRIKRLAVTALIVGLFGCGSIPTRTNFSSEASVEERPSGAAYYLFTAAQLEKKNGALDRAIVLMKKAIEVDPQTSFLKYELAMLLLSQQDQEGALLVLEGVLEKVPPHIESLMMIGRINQSLNRMEAAQRAYERVIAVDPTREDVYVLLGKIYIDAGQLDKALSTYERLVAKYPASYLGYFFLGKILAEQGNVAAAEEKFLQTLELAPELEEPNYELIKLYDKQGRLDKKLAVYEDILKKNPDNIEIMMELALFYQKGGKRNRANEILLNLGLRSETDRTVIPILARQYIEQEAFDDAAVLLEGMLKGAPESSDIHYLLGVTQDERQDKTAAIGYLGKVKPSSRFYQNAVVHMAFIFQELGDIPEAIAVIKAALSTIAPNSELLLYFGSFYEETENYDEAEAAFLKGLEIDPDNANIHFRMGVLYDKRGNRKACIEEMKKAIALDPKHAGALNYLGYTYAEMGIELDQAETLALRAMESQPDDGYITDTLGWVYYKKGQFEKAVNVLEAAVSLVPEDPIILEHLGDAYLKVNNKKKAIELYERSLLKENKNQQAIKEKIRFLKK
ncbi:MAG: tetratricopeptide repeat protein [Desulfobacterales bacterium]|nr:tetratricopeptide repeat protein [Desulfobacterales bacterium]